MRTSIVSLAITFYGLEIHALVQRAPVPVSYAVVNVDGDSLSTPAAKYTTLGPTKTDDTTSMITVTASESGKGIQMAGEVSCEDMEGPVIPRLSGQLVVVPCTKAGWPKNMPVPSTTDEEATKMVTMTITVTEAATNSATIESCDNRLGHLCSEDRTSLTTYSTSLSASALEAALSSSSSLAVPTNALSVPFCAGAPNHTKGCAATSISAMSSTFVGSSAFVTSVRVTNSFCAGAPNYTKGCA